MEFQKLPKLLPGDKVAVLSPSFAAPGKWPHIHDLGLKRLREIFELEPVEFSATRKLGASGAERSADLVAAFEDPSIKGVIASLGGDDQITYIKNLPPTPFVQNPKPFFGFSDNTHFANFLWLNGVPSYYGGALFTQFAMQKEMDAFTTEYLRVALFEESEYELKASDYFKEVGLGWDDPANMDRERERRPNAGWRWDGEENVEGVTWGGCLESIDELLRHGVAIPTLEQFSSVVLMTETSEELPSADYVRRVYRALGERGILARVRAILVGRPKAWEFDKPNSIEERDIYRQRQQEIILATVRHYNSTVPVIQNLDFGHTDPQIPMPYGRHIRIDSAKRSVSAEF
ncbi:MAG: S66 peptidase family protein [Patescibacteria group bacterium]